MANNIFETDFSALTYNLSQKSASVNDDRLLLHLTFAEAFQQAVEVFGHEGEHFAVVGFDLAGVAHFSEAWVQRELTDERYLEGVAGFLHVAFAENIDAFVAIWAAHVAHVLSDAEGWHVHQIDHLQALAHDHVGQALWRGDHEHAANFHALHDGQWHVAGSWWQVDDKVIEVAPADVGDELLDNAGDEGAAPDDRIVVMWQQEVHAHELDAGSALDRFDAIFAHRWLFVDTEELRDAWAGDVGIEQADFKAAFSERHGEHGGEAGFTNAAFAAHDHDDVLDIGMFLCFCQLLFLAAWAGTAAGAGGSAAFTLTHKNSYPFHMKKMLETQQAEETMSIRLLVLCYYTTDFRGSPSL